MANRYWVGSGNWDTTNTANWSATNGGAGGASVPTNVDDVFFTSLSGNCNTLNTTTVQCKTLDMTGYTGVFTGFNSLTSVVEIFGGLILSATATYNTNICTFRMAATDTNGGLGYAIYTNGKILGTLLFAGVGGKWGINDPITCRNTYTHTNGEVVNPLHHKLVATTFSWSGNQARTYNPGSTVHGSTGSGGLTHFNISDATNLTGDFSSVIFQIDASSASGKGINIGTVKKVGRIDYLASVATNGNMNINNNAIIGTLAATSPNGQPKIITVQNCTIDAFDFITLGTGKINIQSNAAGTARLVTLGLPGRASMAGNVELKDITCVQPYRLYIPTGINGGNNTNCNFSAIPATPNVRQSNHSFLSAVTSIPVNFTHSVVAGNTLVAVVDVAANPGGAITLVQSGWTAIFTISQAVSANVVVFSKVADGSETTVTAQWTTSRAAMIEIMELENFTGTVALDGSNSNTGASIASPTPYQVNASLVSPSAVPALAIAVIGGSGGLGATSASYPTNGFQEEEGGTFQTSSTLLKIGVKPLSVVASESTEFMWPTSRNVASGLLIFKAASPANQGNFFAFF